MAKRAARPAAGLERDAKRILADAGRSLARLERSTHRAVAAAAEVAVQCLSSGGTIYFCGNGGSAADAQHFACELSGRYLMDRAALSAVALTTNTSAITAIGNDYGYRHVFSRQLAGLGMQGDVLVAITTSGRSANVLEAVKEARRLGMFVIGMTGRAGAAFAERCDVALVTPSTSTPRIQEGHLAMGHAWCELVERAMFAPRRASARRARKARTPGRGATARGARRKGSRRA